MNPVPHDPVRLPVRVLALGGLAGLAVLTLMDRGATRMFATPWILLLAGTLAAAPLAWLLCLASPATPLRFPAPAWLALAFATVAIPVLGALFSPYRGPSLLNASLPLAAACLFLLVCSWLQADPAENRARLERWFALAAAAIVVVSTAYWLQDVAGLSRSEFLSSDLFLMRNLHPLGHSNYTAGLMLLALPVLARVAWRARGPFRATAIAITGLALLNLFTSGSRGGLIGLALLGAAGVAATRPGWKRFLFITVGAIAIAALMAVGHPRIRALLGPPDPAAEPNISTVQRTAMFEAGILMGTDKPALGWGPGTTPLAYPRYRHAVDGGAENVLQLHSTPVQLWAENGAAGMLAALLLCVLVARGWSQAPFAAVTLAGYGAFAVTDFQLDVPVFAAALAVLAALLAAPAIPPPPPRIRTATGLVVVAAGTLVILLGTRDRTPLLNATALALARDDAQRDRAVALLKESLALNPDQEIAHFNLGWLLAVPDPARAEQHFLAAARLVPDKGGVYFGLGLARLNQGRNAAAAHALALECVNDPRFLASPWWNVPAIADLRPAATAEYTRLLVRAFPQANSLVTWEERQATLLATLAPRLGQVSPGPEMNYRRERRGYPVLMRNLDLAPPVDLYDGREDPRFPASVPFPLPPKGWLSTPRLLKLLDAPPAALQ